MPVWAGRRRGGGNPPRLSKTPLFPVVLDSMGLRLGAVVGPLFLLSPRRWHFVCRLTCMVILLPLSFDLAPVICMIYLLLRRSPKPTQGMRSVRWLGVFSHFAKARPFNPPSPPPALPHLFPGTTHTASRSRIKSAWTGGFRGAAAASSRGQR